MTGVLGSFADFFAAANDGAAPYAWQQRLADRIVDTGRWPDVIAAPTGSGKSAVVDVHVYAVAATAGTNRRPPRRLAVVVNRRALVDAQQDRAERLQHLLDSASEGILAASADRLRSLSGTDQALLVTSVRGGVPTDATWIDDPRVPSVIAMTPDMWGSRLLFRGYGTSRYARPREAGLLAVDSVMVLDEAHLNRQLLQTARDAAGIVEEGLRSSPLNSIPALQIVATTATPTEQAGNGASVVEGVIESDLAASARLRDALTSPKPLELVPTTESAVVGAAHGRYLDLLAAQALRVAEQIDRAEGSATTVLCVVNTVKAAVGLAERLEKTAGVDAVVCWVGRMRPLDLDHLRRHRPGLFSLQGDPTVRFLVATQTVEVGIDIDCAALVTELAPASALTQRCGRVNRHGRRGSGPVCVVVPSGTVVADRGPYLAADLEAARLWLATRTEVGLSPWSLVLEPPPRSTVPRLALSDLNPEHLDLLAQTSDSLLTEIELNFWLRDDLDDRDDTVGVILRGPLPEDDGDALTLLRATPVAAQEVFPATRAVAAELVERVLAGDDHARVFCWRSGELMQLSVGERVRPGDQLVVDHGHALTRRGVVVEAPPVLAEPVRTVWGEDDVRVITPKSPDAHWLEDLVGLTPEEAQLSVVSSDAEDPSGEAGGVDWQVILPPAGSVGSVGTDALPWLVLKPVAQVVGDPELRQEWTPTVDTVVSLDQHRTAVAGRARAMAHDLGLPPVLVAALEDAGLRHDDGKADVEFQSMLYGDVPVRDVVLAKSLRRSAQQSQRRRSGHGWRHEQLSVVHTWLALAGEPDRELVARLVGTSHGRGRPFFPMGGMRLLGGRYSSDLITAADDLFRTGAAWSEVLEMTDREYGVWGVAYLEAVLRAADCQVSSEGS